MADTDNNIMKLALLSYFVNVMVLILFTIWTVSSTGQLLTNQTAVDDVVSTISGDDATAQGRLGDTSATTTMGQVSQDPEDSGGFDTLLETVLNIRNWVGKVVSFVLMVVFLEAIFAVTGALHTGIASVDWIISLGLFVWQITIIYATAYFIIPRLKK